MDSDRFDALARALQALPSRRALLGLGLSGVFGVAVLETVDAKKKN